MCEILCGVIVIGLLFAGAFFLGAWIYLGAVERGAEKLLKKLREEETHELHN